MQLLALFENETRNSFIFVSIDLSLSYLEWIQYQFFEISYRKSLHQKFSIEISSLDRISNHLSISKIFQNFIYFASKSIVLFYSFDEFDISLEIRFCQWNFFSLHRHWNHSSCSRISSKTHLLILANRFFSSVSMITSIFESENQSISQQNLQYRQSHISIWIILDSRETSEIIFAHQTNQSDFFSIDDEVNNISNSNFKSVLQISHIFVQYFDKNSVLRSFVFFENIARSYLFH